MSLCIKGLYSQSYGFFSSVWMWELDHKEGWAPKNWCFQIVVLRRLLRVPWTARKSNQSILKGINPEYSLEGLMLKLKLQYFGHLMRRADSLEKTLMLGNIEGRRRRGWQRKRWLDGLISSMDMNLSKLQETVKDGSLACSSPWGRKELDMPEQLNNNERWMIFHEVWKSYEIQISTPHKCSFNKTQAIHSLPVTYGSFCVIATELSSCYQDCVTCKA